MGGEALLSRPQTADLDSSRRLAFALKRKQAMARTLCFDPNDLASRPTPEQQAIISDVNTLHVVCLGGNQCKPITTQIKMADGTLKSLGEVIPGDSVMAYDRAKDCEVPSTVTAKLGNGVAEVNRYWTDLRYTDSTPNHLMFKRRGGLGLDAISNLSEIISVPSKPFTPGHAQAKGCAGWSRKTITKVEPLGVMPVYDITIDHPDHLYIADGFVTANSGKSQTGGRIVSWHFTNTHPYFPREQEWGDDKIVILVMGAQLLQVEQVLWGEKIKPFLSADEYVEHRQGGALVKVTNPKNGNTILFFSHNNADDARRKVQAYSAHYVWLDEMPDSLKLIEELHRRCQAYRGRFLATFTPKVRVPEIQEYIERPSPVRKIYRLHMLNNPVYNGRHDEILASLEGYSKEYIATVLSGDWTAADNTVFDFSYDHFVAVPDNYLSVWRHALVVDPAAAHKMGYTMWAEDPSTSTWYCIDSHYIEGAAGSELVAAVEKSVTATACNLMLRVSDAAPWFVKEASLLQIVYRTCNKKHDRKTLLIKNLQQALVNGKVKLHPVGARDLISEFQRCQYSGDTTRIKSETKWHLLDCAQYFVDLLPRPVPKPPAVIPHDVLVRQQHEARLQRLAEGRSRPSHVGNYKIVSLGGRVWKSY